ncbi:MAG: hypothetical protein HY000_24670 [Planctomycetes bacterium]|nr:hypothetical protein [Planctomycetota bacterium]
MYAHAVRQGDLTIAQLRAEDRQQIERAILDGGHEAFFLRRWQEHRKFLMAQRSRVRSFDVARLVAGLERLICLHLGSRGYK